MTSGILSDWVERELAHYCGFEGVVEWNYDPEYDRSSFYTDCPECGAEVSEAIE